MRGDSGCPLCTWRCLETGLGKKGEGCFLETAMDKGEANWIGCLDVWRRVDAILVFIFGLMLILGDLGDYSCFSLFGTFWVLFGDLNNSRTFGHLCYHKQRFFGTFVFSHFYASGLLVLHRTPQDSDLPELSLWLGLS